MANTNPTRKSFHPAKPLTRDHMPSDFSISLDQYTSGRSVRIPADLGQVSLYLVLIKAIKILLIISFV